MEAHRFTGFRQEGTYTADCLAGLFPRSVSPVKVIFLICRNKIVDMKLADNAPANRCTKFDRVLKLLLQCQWIFILEKCFI